MDRSVIFRSKKAGIFGAIGQWLLPTVCPICYQPAELQWCKTCHRHLDTCRIHPSQACDRCGLPIGETIHACADSADDPVGGEIENHNGQFDASAKLCGVCAKRPLFEAVDRLRCCFAYHDLVSRAVVSSKYATRTGLIQSFAAELVSLVQSTEIPPIDVVTYVPAHWWRQMTRGGCSVETLSRAIAKQLSLRHAPLLEVTRRLEKQAWLDDDARRQNVAGAFAVRSGQKYRIAGRHVALVDDVVTTGSTTGEIAGVLRDAGAREVSVLSIARAIRR